MIKFKRFFFVENYSSRLSKKEASKAAISKSLNDIIECLESSSFLRKIVSEYNLNEAAKDAHKGISGNISHRRELSPEEEHIAFSQKGGLGAGLTKVFGDKGYLPAVRAWLAELGIDAEDANDMQRKDFSNLNLDNVSKETVKKRLQSSTGLANPLPPHFKESLEMSVLRSIKDKVAAKQLLDPNEQRIYEAWKKIVASSGQIVGNKAGYNKLDKPDDVPPEQYDNLWLRLSGGKVKPGQPVSPTEKMSYQKQMVKPQLHLAHFIAENESGKLFPDEIALNIEDSYKALQNAGVEILSDDQALDMFLDKVKDDILSGKAFVPKMGSTDASNTRRYNRWGEVIHGISSASAGVHNPVSNPGNLQTMTGKARQLVGQQKKQKFGDMVDLKNLPDDLPTPYISLGKEKVGGPNEKINNLYRKNADLLNAELAEPAAKVARKMLPPSDVEDGIQFIVMNMMNKTDIEGWRESPALRAHWAMIYAHHYRDQLNKNKSRSNAQSAGEDGADLLAQKSGAGHAGNEKMTQREKDEIKLKSKNMFDINTQEMEAEDIEKLNKASQLMADARQNKDPQQGMESISILKKLANKYQAVSDALEKLGISSTKDDEDMRNSRDDDMD